MDYKKFERRDAPFWSLKSMRFYIAFLLMFVIFCSVIMRDNLGIAMVCMVNSTAYAKSDEIFGNNSSHIPSQRENRQSMERSTVAAIYTSGYQLGNGLGVLIGARLCSIRFLGGWPLIFYFSGIISITCLILWYFMATNTPSESKLVSNKEKRFLESELKDVPSNSRANKNGLYAAIPFASLFIAKNIIAIVSDKLKQAGVMSMTTSCKIWQSFAAFGTSIVLVCMALFLDCTKPGLALIILILYGIFFAGCMPGAFTAMLSLAPAFTGTIASIENF
uniref:Uncharacterized protein n=1 Tax=Acrobeloides nanus TaxID=290746 RepID=A0A914E1B5_9BILA